MSYKLAGVDWNDDGTIASKELTPLEVIERWKCQIHWNKDFGWEKELNIVETALNELERYKKCIDLEEAEFISTHNMSVIDTETFNQLVKNSQALEIIKEKRVNINQFILNCKGKNKWGYNKTIVKKDRHLTQEQYDLLKEVLK